MMVFGANVPRRKRTALVAPPGGMEEEEEEPAAKNVVDGSSGADGSLVPTSSSSVPAAAGDEAVAAQLNCGEEGKGKVKMLAEDGSDAVAAAQLKSEEERKRKGKMLAEDQSLPILLKDDAPPRPPVAKLMGDAQSPVHTRAPRANKKRKRLGRESWVSMGRDGHSTSSSAGSSNNTEASLDKIDVVHDRLRQTLRELGVSPARIYGKRLWKSDRVMNQHRLLMSCKSWQAKHGVPFPLDEILTAEEKPLVRVQAYDRRGNAFVVNCKKLTCNNAYRIIYNWGTFLTNKGLVLEQDAAPEEVELAMVELWAFRSPKLKVGITDQPNGPLGLVIVHYLQGESPHADAAIADILAAGGRVATPRARGVRNVQAIHVHEDDAVPVLGDDLQVHEEDAVPVSGDVVQVREDVVAPDLGDTVQVHEYAVPILEDAVHAHEDAMEDASGDELDEDRLGAAKALLMLRYSFPKTTKKRRRVRR